MPLSSASIQYHVVHELVKNHLGQTAGQAPRCALTRAEVSRRPRRNPAPKGTGMPRQHPRPQWTHARHRLRPQARSYRLYGKQEGPPPGPEVVLSAKAAEDRIICGGFHPYGRHQDQGVQASGGGEVRRQGRCHHPCGRSDIVRSARNIPGVSPPRRLLNVYDIVNAKYLVIDQNASPLSRRCTHNDLL